MTQPPFQSARLILRLLRFVLQALRLLFLSDHAAKLAVNNGSVGMKPLIVIITDAACNSIQKSKSCT
jgi:hypothetical protein